MPVLEPVGRLLELRLMLDFSGSTRGYAFASYETQRIAREACARLNGYEIRPGHRIGVVKSLDNCRLFFGGVPKDKTKPEFMAELTKMLDDITDIYLYPSAHDRSLNRGFIFVEFKDHRAAAMARRKLIPGKVTLWDHEIAVDWADPEPGEPIDEDIMERVTTLFVRNLALDISQQNVRGIFYRHTNVPILKLKKINHFAFIHYENRQAAQVVMDIMQKPGSIVEKQGWEVCWAKPIGVKNLDRQQYICEAATNSNSISQLQKTKTSRPKQARNKKNHIEIAHEDDSVYSARLEILQNFVKERFDATCTFDCVPMSDASEYIGTVIIHKDQIILFDFRGKPMASKHKALSAACAEIYQYLTSTFPNSALQPVEQHCIQSEIGINPVVGMPISRHSGIVQN
ncbi:unnamed protein product [Lasius platythorax]